MNHILKIYFDKNKILGVKIVRIKYAEKCNFPGVNDVPTASSRECLRHPTSPW